MNGQIVRTLLRVALCAALVGLVGPWKLLRYSPATDGAPCIKDCLDADKDMPGVLPAMQPEMDLHPAQSYPVHFPPSSGFPKVFSSESRAPPA
jgi:hypothetical protein